MTKTTDRAALDEWYAVATAADVGAPVTTRLLGQDIRIAREDGVSVVREIGPQGAGPPLPVREAHACLWTTLGAPARGIVAIPEAAEADRRTVVCGWVHMRTSGLRVVENFLDMAHFPFVHAGILGAEPATEVPRYASEIRRDVDEVWATNCTFFQPRIAATETSGDMVHLTYRVAAPFLVLLYRVCPSAPRRLDVIALFIHPLEAERCRAQPVMWLVDDRSGAADLLAFEQVIFLQDRIIVENQRPLLLALEPRAEIPTRADGSSVLYRRWLKEKGLTFGTTLGPS